MVAMDVTRYNFEESLDALQEAIDDPDFAFWRCARMFIRPPPSHRKPPSDASKHVC